MTRGSPDVAHTGRGRGLNQLLALALGVVYVLVGIAGFFVSETFAGTGQQESGQLLGLFQVNHLHNVVHLLIGVALVAASMRLDTARGAALAIGVTYLALGLLGPLLAGTALDVVALNSADHVLHLAAGALLTAVALLADRRARV